MYQNAYRINTLSFGNAVIVWPMTAALGWWNCALAVCDAIWPPPLIFIVWWGVLLQVLGFAALVTCFELVALNDDIVSDLLHTWGMEACLYHDYGVGSYLIKEGKQETKFSPTMVARGRWHSATDREVTGSISCHCSRILMETKCKKNACVLRLRCILINDRWSELFWSPPLGHPL